MSSKLKENATAVRKKGNRLVLTLDDIEKFKGFQHTEEERKALDERCSTELPEFKEEDEPKK